MISNSSGNDRTVAEVNFNICSAVIGFYCFSNTNSTLNNKIFLICISDEGVIIQKAKICIKAIARSSVENDQFKIKTDRKVFNTLHAFDSCCCLLSSTE